MIIFPGRTIESDVVLVASPDRNVITQDVRYDESDHHSLSFANLHKRFYPRVSDINLQSW
jgi:hypothetical protein